jgi:hypothetical protein
MILAPKVVGYVGIWRQQQRVLVLRPMITAADRASFPRKRRETTFPSNASVRLLQPVGDLADQHAVSFLGDVGDIVGIDVVAELVKQGALVDHCDSLCLQSGNAGAQRAIALRYGLGEVCRAGSSPRGGTGLPDRARGECCIIRARPKGA